MPAFLQFVISVVLIYVCVYAIITRICNCIERVQYTKAYERAILQKQDLEKTKEEFQMGFGPRKS